MLDDKVRLPKGLNGYDNEYFRDQLKLLEVKYSRKKLEIYADVIRGKIKSYQSLKEKLEGLDFEYDNEQEKFCDYPDGDLCSAAEVNLLERSEDMGIDVKEHANLILDNYKNAADQELFLNDTEWNKILSKNGLVIGKDGKVKSLDCNHNLFDALECGTK